MTYQERLTIWRLLLAVALSFAITMALLPHPPTLVNVSDKLQHMSAFATITVFAVLGYPHTPLLRIAERLSFVGALIEVAQSIPALHRDCDIFDWVADTAAILAVIIVVAIIRHVRNDATF